MEIKLRGRGALVAIEGIDGAGKTLQATMLEERLRDAGIDAFRTKEPTNGHVGRLMAAEQAGKRLHPREELEIFLEDRREHVREVIAPALEAGRVVILDRYYFSNAAYQGSRGLDAQEIIEENEGFAPEPDLLILIDTPVETSIRRIRERGEGRTLFEDPEALEACRAVFLSIQKPYLVRIDGLRSPHEIHAAIIRQVDRGPLFRRLCLKPYLEECEYPGLGALRRPVSAPELGPDPR